MNLKSITDYTDNDFYEGLQEIIVDLGKQLDNNNFEAMSQHQLFLQGQKDMLEQVMVYLVNIYE